ncbi:DUF6526 family protein [Ferruginibacter sp.]
MEAQNFKNHRRMVPLFHYVAFTAVLFPFILTLTHFFKTLNEGSGRLQAAAMVSLTVAVILALWFARSFALKAQDRGIRAEESLRYFAITGNLPDSKLKMSQYIALRFAPNNEFVDLAHRAVSENLSSKQIKEAIKNWRGDYNRV